MPFQSVPSGTQVRMFYTMDKVPCENRFFFLRDGAAVRSVYTALAADIKSSWEDYLAPVTSNQASLVGIDITDEEIYNGIKVEYRDDLPMTGFLASPVVANNVSKFHQLSTGRKGRGSGGGWFFVGLAQPDVVTNQVNGRILTASNEFITSIKAKAALRGHLLAVCSRWENTVLRPAGVLLTVDEWGWNNTTSDSMRGRMPKG